jgi:hypothetical protein
MAHAQKPDLFFRRNGQVHLNRRGRQFSRLLAAEGYASAVVMLDTTCSEVVWRVLATHSIRQYPLHLPSRASPCAITFQLDSTLLSNAKYRTSGTGFEPRREAKDFLFSTFVQTGTGAQLNLLYDEYRGSFPRVNRPRRDVRPRYSQRRYRTWQKF